MLAFIAALCFLFGLFEATAGGVDLVVLGLFFAALHLAFGDRVEAFGAGRRS